MQSNLPCLFLHDFSYARLGHCIVDLSPHCPRSRPPPNVRYILRQATAPNFTRNKQCLALVRLPFIISVAKPANREPVRRQSPIASSHTAQLTPNRIVPPALPYSILYVRCLPAVGTLCTASTTTSCSPSFSSLVRFARPHRRSRPRRISSLPTIPSLAPLSTLQPPREAGFHFVSHESSRRHITRSSARRARPDPSRVTIDLGVEALLLRAGNDLLQNCFLRLAY